MSLLPVKRSWVVHNLAEFLEKFDAHDLFEKNYEGKFDEETFEGLDGEVIYELLSLIDGFFDYHFVNSDSGGYFEIYQYDLKKWF